MRQEPLLVNVELLGINRLTDNIKQYNDLATTSTTLPWVQDTSEANVWFHWGVNYRDVLILDSSNRVAGVMNLTEYDLTLATNRTRLKDMLRAVAKAGDSDADNLPDHWEFRSFGALTAGPEEDADGDSHNNLVELAFGSDPANVTDVPRLSLGFGATQFRVSFDRWAGTAADYLLEMSTNLLDWTGSTLSIRPISHTNRVDGTGRSRVTWSLTRTRTVQPEGFVRVNARPRP